MPESQADGADANANTNANANAADSATAADVADIADVANSTAQTRRGWINRRRMAVRLGVLLVAAVALKGCGSHLVNFVAFHPERADPSRGPVQRSGVEELRLTAADGTSLQAFFIANPASDRATLMLHGNAGNAYGRIDDAMILAQQGTNVLLLSYRGYGTSDGRPTEAGVYQDARAALDELAARGFAAEQTFIYGRSIGSAVAIDAARGRILAGLILITPLSSGRDVARHQRLGWLLWAVGHPFDSVSKLPEIDAPMLIIHGDRDGIVPLELGQRLHDSYSGPRRILVLPGAGHNDISATGGSLYWRTIGRFLSAPESLEATAGEGEGSGSPPGG
ncbi:MAG: alpha/beta hydrolase [Phycisphaerales bacterium]